MKENFSPLSPAELHVLVVLAEADSHAYLIVERIQAGMLQSIIIGYTTVKAALKRLEQAGFVAVAVHEKSWTGQSRTVYKLTEKGVDRLRTEQRRLELTLRLVSQRLKAREHGLFNGRQ